MSDEGAGGRQEPERAGVILAGGRSTRFGDADKAFAELAGTPMLRRVADRLGSATDQLVVNCREDQRPRAADVVADHPSPVSVVTDEEPDRGPTAGIATALRATDAEFAAVVACDMPFVEPAIVEHLFERAASVDAAVPRRADGWYQPTQAVYRSEPMLEACERALADGDGRILDALEHLEYEVVEEAAVERFASVESFENINTRDEFEAAENRLRRDEEVL